MEPSLEISFETMNVTGQQQPLTISNVQDSDFDKILADVSMYPHNTPVAISDTFGSNNNDEPFNIDALINSSNDPNDSIHLIENQLSETSIDSDDLLNYLQSLNSQESSQSTFIENFDQSNYYQSDILYQSAISSVALGSSPVEAKAIDNLIAVQNYVEQQNRFIKDAAKSKKNKPRKHQSATVGPVDYILHSGGCQPCTTVQMQNDYAYQQQLLEYDTVDSKKIQIKCQPRSKFRPRTQNECKTSSHYLRCENGVHPEYPTVFISQMWALQSDVNLIEVALMGIDKQPHPYALHNKTTTETFEDHALIFKQGDPNVLYFRLTNEDFQNGFKTFMIELIKSKQDEVITKELIRARQLEQSILRFTRIYQVGKGVFQRDDISEEYSSVMSEAYGDVEVEHMGPRYGPMSGQEMVYIVLKSRILKNDLSICIDEHSTGWQYQMENFTKNGNVVYFLMPAFPYSQFDSIPVNITIYYKGEELFQTTYLYKGSLDQDLAELRLNDIYTNAPSSSMSNSFNPLNLFSATGVCPTSISRKTSTNKKTKRLNNK